MRSYAFPMAIVVAITIGLPGGAMTLSAMGVHGHTAGLQQAQQK